MNLRKSITFLLFLIVAILSIWFFKERVLYVDSAAQLFKIVNFERINVEANRYTSALPDFLPFLFVKLGLSLRWVTMAYSFAFVLSFFILFLISEFFLRVKYAGILILLVATLSARHTFFHPSTETHLALVYCALFYSWIFGRRFTLQNVHPVLYLLVSALLITICYFAHPVTVFLILFILALSLVYHKLTKDYRIYILLAFTLFIYSIKTLVTKTGDYEGHLFQNLTLFNKNLGELGSLYTFKWFTSKLWNLYLPTLFALIATNIWFIIKKKWWQLALINSFSVGFVLISILVYYQPDSEAMLEKSFMPLSFIVFLPVLIEIGELVKRHQQNVFILLSLLVLGNYALIIWTSKKFTIRQQKIIELVHQLDQQGKCKGLISEDDVRSLDIGPDWALSCETIILSSFDNPDKSKTLFVDTKNDATLTERKDLFLYAPFWSKWDQALLNQKYFRLCDEPYIRLLE
ncbi:MAG: hypothetical protein K9H64_08170 [Bacteroidales bacterium]|nr:hypothetical protein [Bacteroidales bacterium]MCF8455806.1 hypothetical protein [Bacteroidales bacterium]